LIIEDSRNHEFVKNLEITHAANIGSYLGVPIILEDGTVFGTLCALDPNPTTFTAVEIEIMTSFARFIATTIDMERLYKQNYAQEQRLRADLDLAKKVQRSVLSDAIYKDKMIIDSYYKPSEALSGDMYCWFEITPQKYGVILIDVMGHGVSASLISMSIRSLLNGLILKEQEPVKVMSTLNNHVKNLFNKDEKISTYMTAIYMTLDVEKKEIEYVNAGHPPGVLLKDGSELVFLEKCCLPLGIFSEITVKKKNIKYERSASSVLYTDGLVDLMDLSINNGMKYMGELLQERTTKMEEDLFIFVKSKVTNFEDQPDDVCFITIDCK
jgi:sigma-B regulation protein RsbU (phosphoserine phosphatase)